MRSSELQECILFVHQFRDLIGIGSAVPEQIGTKLLSPEEKLLGCEHSAGRTGSIDGKGQYRDFDPLGGEERIA